jgi:hypothetical protein
MRQMWERATADPEYQPERIEEPEEPPDFARTDELWRRMSNLQDEFFANVPRSSVHYQRMRNAFDIVRDSLSRGQANMAEAELQALDEILAGIVLTNQEHARMVMAYRNR